MAEASLSTFQLQLRRFAQNRLAMVSLVVLGLIVAFCFLGPLFMPFTGEDADFDNISAPINLFRPTPSAPTTLAATFWCG